MDIKFVDISSMFIFNAQTIFGVCETARNVSKFLKIFNLNFHKKSVVLFVLQGIQN
jgi:hypothetical protein